MAPKTVEIPDPIAPEAPIKTFDQMSEAEFEEWDRDFIAELEAGDDSAARSSLAAGVPIYYAEDDTPAHLLIKEYPDGTGEFVTFNNGSEVFVRAFCQFDAAEAAIGCDPD